MSTYPSEFGDLLLALRLVSQSLGNIPKEHVDQLRFLDETELFGHLLDTLDEVTEIETLMSEIRDYIFICQYKLAHLLHFK